MTKPLPILYNTHIQTKSQKILDTQNLTIVTGQEILDRLSDSFKNDLQTLVNQGKVKGDGSLEEIPNAKDKKIISVDSFRFIVEVQRIS
mgnify:FL=1